MLSLASHKPFTKRIILIRLGLQIKAVSSLPNCNRQIEGITKILTRNVFQMRTILFSCYPTI